MKPDWKNAPKWARYLGMDKDGRWYYHENKPLPGTGHWISSGKYAYAGGWISWEGTREERPKED